MICILDILQNFQRFSSLLDAGCCTIELEYNWLRVQHKDIVMIEWRPSKRHLQRRAGITLVISAIQESQFT